MKKNFLTMLMLLLSLGLWAATENDGKTKDTAIEFNWGSGNVLEATGTDSVWFRVDLQPLYEEENPTLALYLTNLDQDGNSAAVRMSATLLGQTESRSYTIPFKGNMVWSKGAAMLVKMKQTEVYISLATDHKIALSAKVYETAYTDDACTKAIDFNWATGHTQEASAEGKWYKVDLSDAQAATDKDVVIRIENLGSAKASVLGAISPDCPSSGTTDYTMSLAAGASAEKRLNKAMVDQLSAAEVYVKVVADQKVKVTASLEAKEAGTGRNMACQTDATAMQVTLDTDYTVAAGNDKTYWIAKADLQEKRKMPEVTITNTGSATATVNAYVGFTCGTDVDVIKQSTTIGAGQTVVKAIEKNMIEGLSADIVYMQIETTQDLQVSARLKRVGEGDACRHAAIFDWERGALQEGGEATVWYAIGIDEAKESLNDIVVKVTNRTSSEATIRADVAFECPYVDLQSMTRKVAGNEVVTKTIPYSTFSALGTDTIYVGVLSDKAIKIEATMTPVELKEPDDACLSGIVFDWVYGHVQEAGDSVWYKVGLNDVRENKTLIPVLTIRNQGTGALTIEGALSVDCPDSIPNTNRTLTIAKDGVYEKEISRDLLKNIENDTVYIMLRSNQKFAFQVAFKQEKEGESCTSAKIFNWVSGEDLKADSTMWYAIDLSEVKTTKKDVKITITNKDQAECQLLAALAPTCPCETPQEQSGKLAAGAEKSKILPNSTFEKFDTIVYVRLTTGTNIHFQAELVEPEPFDTIDACDPAITLAFDTKYVQTEDSVWYYLPKSVLEQALNADELYTPQVTIWNNTGAKLTIKGEIAYHCPVTQAMESKTVSFSGDSITKILERSMAEQLLSMDSVLIRLVGTGFSFQVSMIDANKGNDCAHAVIIVPGDTINHNWYDMEANTTTWYRLYTSELIANPCMLRATVKSNGTPFGTDATVKAEMFSSCGGDLMQSATRKVYAATSTSKDASSDLLAGLSDSVIYVRISTNEPISLCLDTFARKMLEEPDTICLQAKAVVPNVRYYQAATDTVWYVVDASNLRNNTKGDATLEVTNEAGKQMKMKAELTYDCPVVYEMTEKTVSLNAGETFTKVAERNTINNVNKDFAYLRVSVTNASSFTNVDSLNFILHVLTKENDCDNAIEFDWEKGNIHPADSSLWYTVRLATENPDGTYTYVIPDSCDLRLHIDNLDDKASSAEAGIYAECDEYLDKVNYTFTGLQEKYKDIDYDYIMLSHLTSLKLSFTAGTNMHIWAEFIKAADQKEVYAYNNDTICGSGYFTDTVTLVDHYINVEDTLTWTWNDTVRLEKVLEVVDSIIVFNVLPMTAPVSLPQDTLDLLLGANNYPIIAMAGAKLYLDSMATWLDEQHEARKAANTLPIANKEWRIEVDDEDNPGDKTWTALTDTVLAREATTIRIAYVITADGCADETIGDTIFYAVTPWESDTLKDATPLYTCSGSIDWKGQTFTGIVSDTIIEYKKENITTTFDSLNVTHNLLIDSVYTKVVNLKTIPELQSVATTLSVKYNEALDVTMATTTINALYGEDNIPATQAPLESVAWSYNFKENGVWGTSFVDMLSTSTPVVPLTVDSILMQYTAYFCNGTPKMYVDTIIPDTITLYDTIPEVYCGTSYPWHGKTYTASGLYNDTLQSVVNSRCDSIVTLKLTLTTMPTSMPSMKQYLSAEMEQPVDLYSAIAQLESAYTMDSIIWQYALLENNTWGAFMQVADGATSTPVIPMTADSVILKYTAYFCSGTPIVASPDTIVVDTITLTTTVTVDTCGLNAYTWNGQTYTASGEYTYKTKSVVNSRCDSIVTFSLTLHKLPTLSSVGADLTVKYNETVDITSATDALNTLLASDPSYATPDNILWEYNLMENGIWGSAQPLAGTEIPAIALTVDSLKLTYSVTFCSDTTLSFSEAFLPDTVTFRTSLSVDTCRLPYIWQNGTHTITCEAADEYVDTLQSVINSRCDSIVTLTLTYNEPNVSRKDETVIDTVCAGTDYMGHIINAYTEWKDSVRIIGDDCNDVDSVVVYQIYAYTTDFAEYDMEDIHVICAKAIDLTEANAAIEAAIAAEELAAPNATINWLYRPAGENDFQPWDTTLAIPGGVKEFELGYSISTDCGETDIVSKTYTVEIPTADNVSAYDHIEAKSMYGGRLLMVNLIKLEEFYGFRPDSNMVVWYRMKGAAPAPIQTEDPALRDDSVGVGYYYTLLDGSPLEGTYYARITFESSVADECTEILRTQTLDCLGPKKMPAIRPTMAAPGETVEIYNLDGEAVDIRVYDVQGSLMQTYRVENVNTFSMPAAPQSGYYMVNVENETDKTTLKYIVK